jgi:hypothetical protein
VAGRGWRAPSRDAVGLLDERNRDSQFDGDVGYGHEIGSGDAPAGAVAQDQRAGRASRGEVQVGPGPTAGSVDVQCEGAPAHGVTARLLTA